MRRRRLVVVLLVVVHRLMMRVHHLLGHCVCVRVRWHATRAHGRGRALWSVSGGCGRGVIAVVSAHVRVYVELTATVWPWAAESCRGKG